MPFDRNGGGRQETLVSRLSRPLIVAGAVLALSYPFWDKIPGLNHFANSSSQPRLSSYSLNHAGNNVADSGNMQSNNNSPIPFNLEFVDSGLYPGQADNIQPELNAAFQYVHGRFYEKIGPVLKQPIPDPQNMTVQFINDSGCALTGLTQDEVHKIQVYTCNRISISAATSILAHEYGHQLAYDVFGNRKGRYDPMLGEGLATYLAGDYWNEGFPDFRSRAKSQFDQGIYYPLNTSSIGQPYAVMNDLYYEWASLLEYILATPEFADKFPALYTSGDENTFGSAHFEEILGISLSELEQRWKAWVIAQ